MGLVSLPGYSRWWGNIMTDDTIDEEGRDVSSEELIAKLDDKYLSLRMQIELFKDRMRSMNLELERMTKAIQAKSFEFRQDKEKYVKLLPLNNDLRRVIEDNNKIVATVLSIGQDMSNKIQDRVSDIFELTESIELLEEAQGPVLSALSTEIDSLRDELKISNAISMNIFSLDEKKRKKVRREIVDPPDILHAGNIPAVPQEEENSEKEISDIEKDIGELEEDHIKGLKELFNQG